MNGLINEYRGKSFLQRIDIDNPANRQIVAAFNVSATPTIVILNDQGKVSTQFIGFTDASYIRAAIEKALSESVGQANPAA